ncbi:MAG: hypothetical protein MJE77_12105 [Proteobacteria bacterium]|nr:hypothetical protein [Pseudomonadota bacterium]
MQLYVVIDTQGDGRIMGVFDSRESANELVGIDPNYYKLYPCMLNEVSSTSLRWARTDEQRSRLQHVATRLAKK